MKFLESKKFLTILSFIGLYLFSAGTSWAIFSFVTQAPGVSVETPSELQAARSKINLDLPRTQECPINGGMFTKIEENIWQKRRPVAAMVENHADSRPPSGLSRADVIYEAVAEGGITRFLTIFYCGAAADDVKIAPVRSARIYFVDWAAEYGDFPIFMHVGGANDFSGFGDTTKNARALETLETLGWRVPRGNDFDTTYDSGFPVFWRNYERLGREVATEHTMMASLDAAYEQAGKRGFGDKYEGKAWDKNFVSWNFVDEKPMASPAADKISFGFWEDYGDYEVEWRYDKASNSYLRFNGGKAHTDLEYDNVQLSAKNVVVMFVKETGPGDRNKHMLYTTTGEGKALIFANGDVIEGTWEKTSREARTKFSDTSGKEVSFVRGVIWIEAVPAGNDVDY
ncbi:hypothetical protein A3F62_01070 [Candidatus Woesebacteria bacterium RIFCSPHIGHO2_12_FULL_44_11]|nr:MAG: hypothetical protein A3F62_01070 [Candidatus Woesebacteria bacterium RIFCSPHIGHO2_12_FULL_44_11]